MDSSQMSRLQLTYTIQSSSYRKETLMGVEYEVFGIISNYGDTVVWPGNAPGPVLIPKSALISLAELRNGRYVVVNHPTYFGQDVPSTFNKSVIEAHTIGSWFNNYYDGVRNCIRGEIWIDPVRSGEVTGAQDILDRLRSGEKVEISESNVCFSDHTPGELNGQHYDEVLLIMVPEHIAVLPEGWVGACSNGGGCGAGINMSRNVGQTASKGVPMTISQTAKWIFRGLQGLGERTEAPKTANQILVTDIWSLLDAAIAAVEPAFWGVRNFDPDKGLVFYATRIIMGDRYDGKTETKVFMRSYSIVNGVVTLGTEAAEVIATETYEPIGTLNEVNQVNQASEEESVPVSVNINDNSAAKEIINETNNPPCGCKGEQMSETNPKSSDTPVVTPAAVEPNQAPASGGTNVSTTEPDSATTTTTNTTPNPATVNEQASSTGAVDWWANVPPEVRTVLQGIATQESARFEQLVKVAVNQGLPESAVRKLSSTELVTVLEKFGIQSQSGVPMTAALTNEAGGTKQRPSPWSGAGSKVATGATGANGKAN